MTGQNLKSIIRLEFARGEVALTVPIENIPLKREGSAQNRPVKDTHGGRDYLLTDSITRNNRNRTSCHCTHIQENV